MTGHTFSKQNSSNLLEVAGLKGKSTAGKSNVDQTDLA